MMRTSVLVHYDELPSGAVAVALDAQPCKNLILRPCRPSFVQIMLSRYPLPTLIVLVACTLLTALLPFLAASLSVSHDSMANVQAGLGRHANIPSADQDASAHQHDDGSFEEGRQGHQHGHSASDHTHESLFVPPVHALVLCVEMPPWSLRNGGSGTSAHVAALERPPKPTTA
jgi:hypothetical protein